MLMNRSEQHFFIIVIQYIHGSVYTVTIGSGEAALNRNIHAYLHKHQTHSRRPSFSIATGLITLIQHQSVVRQFVKLVFRDLR